VQIETESVGDLERVGSAIESMGYEVSIPGEAFERWRWAMRGGFALVLALGLGVLLIALGNVANTFALVMTERREEIGLLQALGATKGTVRRLYLAEVAWIGVTASVVGGLLAAALAWIASGFLERWTASLATVETLSVVPRPLVLAAIILAVLAMSLGVTWPVVTRATHRTPAQLLRE
jgi:putative ABC transport system permease protein